jgi:imidazolonepropionase-like amidohydrolase
VSAAVPPRPTPRRARSRRWGVGARESSVRQAARITVLVSLSAGCATHCSAPRESDATGYVALVGGTVYPTPDQGPIRNGVVLIDGARVVDVGERERVRIPAGARQIDVAGLTVLPGFWNSHVHFTESKWAGIDTTPSDRVSGLLQEMLTRFGFVHVFDIASFVERTLVLQRRVRDGEVLGPDILTTLTPFVPRNGTPRYAAPLKLPELRDSFGARDSVRARVAQGADAIKLFTASLTSTKPFPVMALAVVEAVTDEAHRGGRLVFAHPTNLAGVTVAVAGGVDILAHSAPMAGALPDSLLREMLRRRVALIPTLTLWEHDYGRDTTGMRAFVRTGQNQVRAYAERGGRILFGTDVGYLTRYDPTREYELMADAGLPLREILRSLTTLPAEEFGWGGRTGRLAPRYDADVVVIDGDPAQDIRALARVRLTMKRGRIIYSYPARPDRAR